MNPIDIMPLPIQTDQGVFECTAMPTGINIPGDRPTFQIYLENTPIGTIFRERRMWSYVALRVVPDLEWTEGLVRATGGRLETHYDL